ncbi:hypothetical protein NDU88_002240, partial [Pleurodeles waltl]
CVRGKTNVLLLLRHRPESAPKWSSVCKAQGRPDSPSLRYMSISSAYSEI